MTTPSVTMTELAKAALSDTPGTYRLTVSNGSATTSVELAGTQRTTWTHAQAMADHGAFGPGTWTVQGITRTGGAAAEFTVIA